MKILVTGDPEKSRVKKLIKLMAEAGHEVVIDDTKETVRGLSIREVIMEGDTETLGKAIKVEASHPSDRMRLVTPGSTNNRKARRKVAARKRRRKGR